MWAATRTASQIRHEAAAQGMGVPMTVLRVGSHEAQALYAANCVLIRPDHHVAWRGDAGADPEPALAMVCARPVAVAQTV